jgi:hypothetical protein
MPLGCDSLSLLTGRIFCPLGVTEPTFLTPITPFSWSYVLTNEVESLVYLCQHSVRSQWTISKGKGMIRVRALTDGKDSTGIIIRRKHGDNSVFLGVHGFRTMIALHFFFILKVFGKIGILWTVPIGILCR